MSGLWLAFASPITDTGMQQKDSKEYAGQVSNSGRNWAIKVSKRNLDEVFIRISLQSSEFFLIIIEYILEFAGKNFMAIRKCKELLEQQYGNYMAPPKKNKFLTTLCVILKFKRNKTWKKELE